METYKGMPSNRIDTYNSTVRIIDINYDLYDLIKNYEDYIGYIFYIYDRMHRKAPLIYTPKDDRYRIKGSSSTFSVANRSLLYPRTVTMKRKFYMRKSFEKIALDLKPFTYFFDTPTEIMSFYDSIDMLIRSYKFNNKTLKFEPIQND